MKRSLILLFFFFLVFSFEGLFCQNNGITGIVKIEKNNKSRRISRGKSYRQRIENGKEFEKPRIKTKKGFVVVSLHPVGFNLRVKPLESAMIYQKDKSFFPKILPITKGTKVSFVNQDDFYHNVFSNTPKARFNIGRRPTGTKVEKTINSTGKIKIFCDVHPQMNATILSLDTPFFTQLKENGTYYFENIPDGEYILKVHSLGLKTVEEKIILQNGETVQKDFSLTFQKESGPYDRHIRIDFRALCFSSSEMCNSKE